MPSSGEPWPISKWRNHLQTCPRRISDGLLDQPIQMWKMGRRLGFSLAIVIFFVFNAAALRRCRQRAPTPMGTKSRWVRSSCRPKRTAFQSVKKQQRVVAVIAAGPSAASVGRPTALFLGATHGSGAGAMGRLARQELGWAISPGTILVRAHGGQDVPWPAAVNFKNHRQNFIWFLVMCEDASLVWNFGGVSLS